MRRLDEAFAEMKSGTPFELTLGENDLTSMANAYAAGKVGLSLSDIVVAITVSEMTVMAKTQLARLPIALKVVGTPRLVEGRIGFDISSMDLNGTSAPTLVKNQILATINEKLDPDNLPIEVGQIELAQGAIRVAGTVK